MLRESVLPLILENYEKFTVVERTIADYFISNRLKEDFSARALKERLYVSEASLSRFAQKCGFKGYREFIFRYEDAFLEQNENVYFGFQQVLNAYNELLNQSVSIVDENQIKHFCELINNAKRVSVLGIGSSGLAAREMKSRFMRLGILMDAIDQRDDMKMQSILQDEESLVIGISLSGKKSEVIFSLKKAYESHAKTVLITANRDDNFHYCSEVIVVPSFQGMDAGHIISPQFPILIVLDMCYNYLYHYISDQNNREELHRKTVKVLDEGDGL